MQTLYLHGYNGSPTGTKSLFFKEHFKNFLAPDLKPDFSTTSFTDKFNIALTAHKRGIIIASSLGGYLAALVAEAAPTEALILLAPAFDFFNRRTDLPPEIQEDGKQYHAYPNVSCPCLVFIGDKDDRVPLDTPKEFCARNPNRQLIIIENGDHRLHGFLNAILAEMKIFLANLNIPLA